MISIVIPFYNEEKRLNSGKTVEDALSHLTESLAKIDTLEFVLVDDGSCDATYIMLQNIKSQNPLITVLHYEQNKGKGHAVKTGILASKGEKIVTMDADFSIDIDETKKFVLALDDYDIVIGTKKHSLTQTQKKQPFLRTFMGKTYTQLTDIFMEIQFTDITCGMKGFRADVGKIIFEKQLIDRWAYDSETLFLANKLHYSVTEIPVTWHHVEGSTISPVIEAMRTGKDFVRILYYYYTGNYHLS